MSKTNIGKWVLIGISFKDRNKIYQRIRIKANTILKRKHKEEYKKIIKSILIREYKKVSRTLKAGDR